MLYGTNSNLGSSSSEGKLHHDSFSFHFWVVLAHRCRKHQCSVEYVCAASSKIANETSSAAHTVKTTQLPSHMQILLDETRKVQMQTLHVSAYSAFSLLKEPDAVCKGTKWHKTLRPAPTAVANTMNMAQPFVV